MIAGDGGGDGDEDRDRDRDTEDGVRGLGDKEDGVRGLEDVGGDILISIRRSQEVALGNPQNSVCEDNGDSQVAGLIRCADARLQAVLGAEPAELEVPNTT